MDLRAAVDELYGVPLGDFVATRTRLTTTAKGDDPALAAEIKALRKPTVAAWLLNRVARDEPQVITDLEELGARMRSAQSQGDMPALAQARPERRAAIDALIAAAGRCAEASGATFGPSTQDEVDATAVAALADEQSGRALASGSLLRPLSYAGFGEVELDDAVATPLRLVPPLPDDETDDADETEDDTKEAQEAERARQQELEQARDELREAERELGAARLAESRARAALVSARDLVNTHEARVADVTSLITRLETRPKA
ncbi:hypothetical protein ASG73_03060 [Janibacter sp. Soil728]|uniref:hypothetical protein n=1 Tax=Janibacter sp. Soil728 TaxID=1736393 RepID=UPI0006F4C38E|nr:hypothetical protein [Janibacter sp. Soil728]KRE39323.1 hypothetical protein ASG73_03060 [Janibacter sp. Soil728]